MRAKRNKKIPKSQQQKLQVQVIPGTFCPRIGADCLLLYILYPATRRWRLHFTIRKESFQEVTVGLSFYD
ncbi:MAG: hypothetical protein CVU64_19980 [Deltaproteobacteria bacterium HGW-Deltaproteobacteria-21]|nr:MAG: hypothetical protein CVU64_19980 [Deltaproteobacteria bacterium HGW-Deltaproteobacteria-21]